jgi:hypothetical protein
MGLSISTRSGGGLLGKIIFSAFGLFFAFIGTQFVRQEWRNLKETQAMQRWTPTACTIVSSEINDEGEDFRLEVTYRYQVNGQTYTAERYSRNKYFTAETIGEIDRIGKQFPAGQPATCHYHPARPDEAVLTLPTVKSARTSLGLTFLFPGFGLLFAAIPWWGGRGKRKAEPEQTRDAKPGKRPAKWAPVIFGAVFAVIGLAVLKPLVLTPLQKSRGARTWDSVPATVVSSKVKSHKGDDSTTYSVYIAYRYEAGSEEYLGDRYHFMGGSSSGYEGKAEVVRQYPKGRTFNIYVNPADPSESVINRDASKSLLPGLIPLLFFVVGVIIMIAGLRAKKATLDPAQSREHVVALKGASSVGKAAGITLFAAAWSGIVFIIFKSDAPILFHIVFGAAGIFVIGAAIHAVLAIFNPRPEVEITPGSIRPGTSVAMRWRTTGRADRIGNLVITLQCLRITTETRRSGGKTRTTTVKKPILTQELLQTGSPNEIVQGTLQFRIPEEQPASRPGNHDGIRWQLLFHGEIPQWPDMKEELGFTVYPAETGF